MFSLYQWNVQILSLFLPFHLFYHYGHPIVYVNLIFFTSRLSKHSCMSLYFCHNSYPIRTISGGINILYIPFLYFSSNSLPYASPTIYRLMLCSTNLLDRYKLIIIWISSSVPILCSFFSMIFLLISLTFPHHLSSKNCLRLSDAVTAITPRLAIIWLAKP